MNSLNAGKENWKVYFGPVFGSKSCFQFLDLSYVKLQGKTIFFMKLVFEEPTCF